MKEAKCEPTWNFASVSPSMHRPVSAQRDDFQFRKSTETRVFAQRSKEKQADFSGHLPKPRKYLDAVQWKEHGIQEQPDLDSDPAYTTYFLCDLGEVTEPL